jgi:cyclophilin family peptidyl-prolyl cis-trans isomerase
MARTSEVDSATAQFFINVADNDFLNHGGRDFGYAVFGRVIDGMDTVDAIAQVSTDNRDVPEEPIVITSAEIKQPE